MYSVKLGDLLKEFATIVNDGELKKMPYDDWRLLKKYEDEYVRVERDDWGNLIIIGVNNNKMLSGCWWPYNDESFGTYLDNIYIYEFNTNKLSGYDYIDSKCLKDEVLNVNGKENDSMNLFKNFDFGSCENDNVKVSMYGIAVKNATGTWVSYDPKSGNVIDVDILNFDAKYLYKMPVAIKDVAPGDVVIHNRKPMFVVNIDGSKLDVIDPAAGEEKIVLLTKSMFGFDFVTKVVNFLGNISVGASEDAPFGNILPLMMLADGGKSDDILPLMFLTNGGNFDMSNPMMLYFLMNNNNAKLNDMLPVYLFMNGSYLGAPNTKICNCGCDKTDA